MFVTNLKLAFRNLLRNKVYSSLIIGGFAIGFVACILIALFYRKETTVNNGFTDHNRIYRIYDVKMKRFNLNWDLYPVITSDYAAVENACPLDYFQNTEKMAVSDERTGKSVFLKHLAASTNDFFSVFSVDLIETISGKPFNDRESIAISRELAFSLFGNNNPLGEKINVGNYFKGTVSSVFNDFPANSSFMADVIINSENENFRLSNTTVNGKRYNPTNHFVKLKDATSPADFVNELNRSTAFEALDVDSLALQKLDDIYLSDLKLKSSHSKGNPTLLKILMAVAALILFLSSINYLNYWISMQYTKLRVVGIKKSFGANRKNLIIYTLIEVALGMSISLVIAAVLTDMALSYSGVIFGKQLIITWQDFLAVLPIFSIVLVILIFINSITPVILLSKFKISEFLSGIKEKSRGRQLWKKALLTFQLTVSTALIAIVTIIFRQMNYVNHSDPGFTKEQLLKIDIPYMFQNTKLLQQEIQKLSFVENTAVSAGSPGMINHKYGMGSEENSIDMNCIYVGDNYLKTMEIELLEGQDFLPGDLNRSCLVNQQALKDLGWNSYQGKELDIVQPGGYNVIGVIKDFKFESFHETIEPLALILTGADDGNVLSVRLMAGNKIQQIEQIEKTWKKFSPNEPLSFVFYDDFFQAMYVKEKRLTSTITFFSLIAIVLTCMGLLGQVFMICMTRMKEIGIRRINGASISGMLIMLNKDLLIMALISFSVSLPASWFIMQKWLQGFAYRTSLSWWVFAMAGMISFLIALITVSWQSWRAATTNPVEAIRYE
ncbi:MAG TPA: ABC transporter permease [Bacteroidales bacterium]|nr:ABC transporter permease [Bacteroidales bacterium]